MSHQSFPTAALLLMTLVAAMSVACSPQSRTAASNPNSAVRTCHHTHRAMAIQPVAERPTILLERAHEETSHPDALSTEQAVRPTEPKKLPARLDVRTTKRRNEVVLTFDDGPYVKHTPFVLNALGKHEMKATFFVLGRHITARTYHLIQRMHREGHAIGSHSYDHDIRMAHRAGSIDTIAGQHRVTAMRIQLALLATSADDFDALSNDVFGIGQGTRLKAGALASSSNYEAAFRLLINRRAAGELPYDVMLSRAPGGGPFLGRQVAAQARYDAALANVGMINVMWHSQSGDVDQERATDAGFLRQNFASAARRGGLVLVHDFIRRDALAAALDSWARDGVEVISIWDYAKRA